MGVFKKYEKPYYLKRLVTRSGKLIPKMRLNSIDYDKCITNNLISDDSLVAVADRFLAYPGKNTGNITHTFTITDEGIHISSRSSSYTKFIKCNSSKEILKVWKKYIKLPVYTKGDLIGIKEEINRLLDTLTEEDLRKGSNIKTVDDKLYRIKKYHINLSTLIRYDSNKIMEYLIKLKNYNDSPSTLFTKSGIDKLSTGLVSIYNKLNKVKL